MLTLERSRRVGRSQAASIFWGLVSVFFAAAACYYFWKYHENETSADVYRDSALNLQDQLDALKSQKEQLQSNLGETEAQLKTREDFLSDKEAKLGQEESRLEGLAAQSDSQSDQNRLQANGVKNFNDAVRKLANGQDTDVVVRGGRPVLRVPDSVFFEFGEANLKPEGKALLKSIADAMDGQLDNFELRVDTFTDSGGEADPANAAAQAPPSDSGTGTPDSAPTPRTGSAWELTGRRAGALARYIREQTSLPFQDVLVVPRADFQPIIASSNEGHARNRRVEITITPLPAAYHPSDTSTTDASGHSKAKSLAHHPDKSEGLSNAKTDDHDKGSGTSGESHAADATSVPSSKAKKDEGTSSKEQP